MSEDKEEFIEDEEFEDMDDLSNFEVDDELQIESIEEIEEEPKHEDTEFDIIFQSMNTTI